MSFLDPALVAIGVVFATLLAIASNRVPQDAAFLGALVVLLVGGVLSPQQALAGFANTGVATVAVLYVIVAALRETSAMEWALQRLLGNPRDLKDGLLKLLLPASVLSAFINNTPVAAALIPVAQGWQARFRLSPSKLLMPLSFTVVLAGTCTLIGTSTNLVVDGLLRQSGHAGMGMFDITPVGLAVTAVGLVYVLLFADRLLPERVGAVAQLANARQYAFELRVLPGGPLVGKSIEEAGLRHMAYAYVLEIERQGRLVTAVGKDEVLQADDRLVCVGIVEALADLRRIAGLAVAEEQTFKLDLDRAQRCLVELVLSPSAPFIGSSVRDARFRSSFGAAILSISRDGERLAGKVGDIVLRGGDTLLVETDTGFESRHRFDRTFLLVSALRDSTPPDLRRAPLALGILVAVIVVSTLGWLDLLVAGFLGAGAMLLGRCLSLDAARRSLDWEVLIVIAASLGLGTALHLTGAAKLVADAMVGAAAAQPLATLAAIYLTTVVFTELISNNAAAALMFPIAVAAAQQLGVDPMPFVVGVMFAASLSFITPIGYQTNLMVYGPGGYRFTDYVRFGTPLTLLTTLVALGLIPLVFPFQP
jgi:di/tricarboxylate transporter